MTFAFEQPPAELTWYYLGPLLDADAGTLRYDKDRYRVSGVSNNAAACVWCGLLAADEHALILTGLGRQMLADWKASPRGQAWLAEWAEPDAHPVDAADRAACPAQRAPARADQLDLFEATS